MKKTYKGVILKGLRDFSKLNFGLQARQLDRALINASLEQVGGTKNNTHLARLAACRDFAQFVKTETDVKRLEHLSKSHITQYGEYLRERFEREHISCSTARDYLSHVNKCLEQARGDDSLRVRATKELAFPPKSGIALEDKSVPESLHKKVLGQVSEPVAVVCSLQRAFGLRMREGSLLDCEKALQEAMRDNQISIKRGTKGGQARVVPITNTEQLNVLERGKALQQRINHDNATPSSLSFKAFQTSAYRETKNADETYLSHGERKHFANTQYELKMGALSPVRAGIAHGKAHHEYLAKTLNVSLSEAKVRDKSVRLEISKMLGHHRIGITNAYLG
ncbi:putative integrase [Vibrio ishigakensis]|uniref:Putative integrase n=1 Tax=Vibrio ishigakensis TaxID=1481914 RepID=A0A0B8NNP2_9VIBR|nr:integrase domain-containing protein [Vibrio ishigakensis]GAM55641.1 putative integrase [Vibrio ishigakensis]